MANTGRTMQLRTACTEESSWRSGSPANPSRDDNLRMGDCVMTGDPMPLFAKVAAVDSWNQTATLDVYEIIGEEEITGFPIIDAHDILQLPYPFSRLASRAHIIFEGRKGIVNLACLETAACLREIKGI